MNNLIIAGISGNMTYALLNALDMWLKGVQAW